MKLKLKPPLKFWSITQHFGENGVSYYKTDGLKGHNGIDFYAPDGTPVYATHDGVVTFSGDDGSGGLGIVIRTTKKFNYGKKQSYYKTIYWHLKKGGIKVIASQSVKTGDLIALADNTGRSTGSHLHYGLKPIYKGEKDWEWYNAEQTNGYKGSVNPMPYFDKPKFNPKRILKLGCEGEDVKEMQGLLGSFGYWIVFDGKFGKRSENIVKDFQKKKGLKIDGMVGKNTIDKLNDILDNTKVAIIR